MDLDSETSYFVIFDKDVMDFIRLSASAMRDIQIKEG